MVFTTIVFSFGDDWFSSLPGKTGKGSLWHPFWQDSHMDLHGGNTSHRESIQPTGQAHLIMFADMVIEGLITGGPESTQGAEVCIHLAAL